MIEEMLKLFLLAMILAAESVDLGK